MHIQPCDFTCQSCGLEALRSTRSRTTTVEKSPGSQVVMLHASKPEQLRPGQDSWSKACCHSCCSSRCMLVV